MMHKSTKWVLGLIAVMTASTIPGALIWLGYMPPPDISYDVLKSIHIIGAVILLGNIIVTGFWMIWAHRFGNEQAVRFAAVTVNWADVFFTAPGAILVSATGAILFHQWGGLFELLWLKLGLILFSISGIIWVIFLLPMQDKLARMAEDGAPLPPEFFSMLKRWYVWGTAATVTPLASSILMVIKPD